MGVDRGGHDGVRDVPVAPTMDTWYAALTTSVAIDLDAAFLAADATRTALAAGTMDAVVSLDVVQLVADRSAFYEEVVRVTRPGGLAVISTWQANGNGDAERYPRDLAGKLTEAGLEVEAVHERPAWVQHQTSVYALALATEQNHPDDGPLKRLVAEAKSFFANPQRRRRLLSVSRRPLECLTR